MERNQHINPPPQRPSTPTAAILIIGNEILSGKTPDANTPFLCRELWQLGVDVQRIVVVPDSSRSIADEIRGCLRYDLIFTTGGIGPTHDDVTLEGIAQGLGRRMIRHPDLESQLRRIYADTFEEAHLKLAEIPEGTDLIRASGLRVPVLRVEKVYIFPGVPELLRRKFNAIKERFKQSPFYLKKIFLHAREDTIARHLNRTVRIFPHLSLGSYPVWANPDFDLLLTLESKDRDYLETAFGELMSLLPKEAIVRLE